MKTKILCEKTVSGYLRTKINMNVIRRCLEQLKQRSFNTEYPIL